MYEDTKVHSNMWKPNADLKVVRFKICLMNPKREDCYSIALIETRRCFYIYRSLCLVGV